MRIVGVLAALSLVGCGSAPLGDVTPPRLMGTEISDDGLVVALAFDEPVNQAESAIDHQSPQETQVSGTVVKVPLPPDLKPGSGHVWSAEVSDEGKNTTSVAGKFYAPNPHPAGLRLNEVRIAGSGTHTDMVEVRVEAPGSLGGWTVEAWSGPEAPQRTVLPDVEVSPGDLVVLRYKAAGDPTDTAPGAREYWQADPKGLSATKGLIVLRQHPDGAALDGLLYAKKPGDAAPLAQAAGWTGTELDPTACTATRTWCRTDEASPGWMVVTSGASTPGGANKLIPWTGASSSRAAPSKSKG